MREVALGALAMTLVLNASGCDRCSQRTGGVDAGTPTSIPTASSSATVPSLEPTPPEEDAGALDAAPAKKGVPTSTNVARLKQCCAQLSVEGRKLGASPEAGLLLAAAGQCNALAAQAGASGTAPELGAIRTALKGRTVPPVCAGF